MRTVAIVQARMGSSRLPNKVLADICGHPALWHIFKRVIKSKKTDDFVIATSVQSGDDEIEAFANQNRISVFRGSEQNVLERFYFAAREAKAEAVVRLTGDNVLVSPEVVDDAITYFQERGDLDYLYYREGLPLGVAVEIMTFAALECAYQEAKDAECLEHVTPYLYRNPKKFRCFRYPCAGEDFSSIRWTMDTQEDYELIKKMYGNLYTEGECFGYQDALKVYQEHTAWSALNRSVKQKKVRYQGEGMDQQVKKTVYITGIMGMLGCNIAFLLKEKYNVTGCDLIEGNIADITFDIINLQNAGMVEESILKYNTDVLIHTAAMVNVDQCEEDPDRAWKANTETTRMLADICKRNGIKMIYISTDAVFDGEEKKLYTEDDPVNPVNVYGQTKFDGEKSVLENDQSIVFRTNIYGYNLQNKESFGEWILNALLRGDNLNMFEDIFFSPILVNDLTDIIDQSICRNLHGLYHVCGTGAISKYEFGCELKKIFRISQGSITRCNSSSFDFRAKRAHHMGMSNEKIKKDLGVEIRTPVESIEYFRSLYVEKYPQKMKGGI